MLKYFFVLVFVLSFSCNLFAEVPEGFKVIANEGPEWVNLPPGWKEVWDDNETKTLSSLSPSSEDKARGFIIFA